MIKNTLFAVMVLATLGVKVKAEGLGDQISASLINHVATHSEWTTKGENRLSLLADIVELGKMDGKPIGQIRFGYAGITNQDTGTVEPSSGYVGDVYMNIAPFVRKYVSLDPDWTFLSSIEMGPAFAYDFAQKHSYLAFSVGLAFGLQPK